MFSQSKLFSKAKDVFITGKVLNFDKHRDHKVINFYFINDLLYYDSGSLVAEIDENGGFMLQFTTTYEQEICLSYGGTASLLCSPGENLYVEIDADIYNDVQNLYPNGRYFINNVLGPSSDANLLMFNFLEHLPSAPYSGDSAKNAIKTMTPNEYVDYTNRMSKDYFRYLKQFLEGKRKNDQFIAWANDWCKYNEWNRLFDFRSDKRKETNIVWPKTYFSFIDNYDLNKSKMISRNHSEWLNNMLDYSMRTPSDSSVKAMSLDVTSGYRVVCNTICLNTKGVLQEVMLAKLYIALTRAQMLKLAESIFDSTLIKEPYIKLTVKDEFLKMRNFLTYRDIPIGTKIDSLDKRITKGILDSIIAPFKNKVIYVDFWATWCAPCLEGMNYSKLIQQHFLGKDVVFLYLGNRCSEDSWRATIATRSITGEHRLLTDDQFAILAAKYGISGIPQYMLIDKSGRVYQSDAMHPRNEVELIKEIDKLLEK